MPALRPRPLRRWFLLLGGLLLAGLLALTGCGTGTGGGDTPAPTATPGPLLISIRIEDGTVSPSGETVRTTRGQRIRVSGVSDVADSVHVHGYNKTLTLSPGQTAQVDFIADQSGVFEIETHENGTLAVKLIVT